MFEHRKQHIGEPTYRAIPANSDVRGSRKFARGGPTQLCQHVFRKEEETIQMSLKTDNHRPASESPFYGLSLAGR